MCRVWASSSVALLFRSLPYQVRGRLWSRPSRPRAAHGPGDHCPPAAAGAGAANRLQRLVLTACRAACWLLRKRIHLLPVGPTAVAPLAYSFCACGHRSATFCLHLPLIYGGPACSVAVRHMQGGWDERDEARVMSSTGCGSRAMVRRALEASKGDVEAAIEQIIERMAAGDEGFGFDGDADGEGEGAEGGEKNTQTGDVVGAEALEERAVDGGRAMGAGEGGGESGKAQDAGNLRQEGRTADGADGGAEHRVRAVQESVPDASGQSSSARAAVGAHAGPGSALHAHGGSAGKGAQAEAKGGASGKSGDGKEAPAKGPSNNKPCPCGSKKKYKACCGPAAAAAARRRQAAGEEAGSAAESQGAVVTAVVAQVAALVI